MTEKKNQKKQNKVFIFKDVDVAPYVSKKMNLSYLNWAFVVATLRNADPNSSYSVKQYPEIDSRTHQLTGRKVNYFADMNGTDSYVTVKVTFRGQSLTESLPCYNYSGKVPEFPDGLLVNKTVKRCYVKAAAMLTGLGISLYINGSTELGENHRNANRNNSRSYPRRSYSGRSRNRNYPRNTNHSQGRSQNGNNSTAFATEKQVGYIKGLIKQTDSDGSEQYKWLENNYKTLNALEFGAASRFIKYLQGLKTKQTNQKANSKKQKPASKKTPKTKTKNSNKKESKQTTLLK